jgi:hypothetical protein
MIVHIGHVLVVKGQLRQAWPLVLVGCIGRASDIEDFMKLVLVVLPCEERCSVNDLCKDASD